MQLELPRVTFSVQNLVHWNSWQGTFLGNLHFQLRNGFAVLLAKGLQQASFSFTVWLHLHNATGSIILISYEMTKVLTMPKERLAAVLHRVSFVMRVTPCNYHHLVEMPMPVGTLAITCHCSWIAQVFHAMTPWLGFAKHSEVPKASKAVAARRCIKICSIM